MFPLNTILAWHILTLIMNKKYKNNNIIIITYRAYFQHKLS
jgi:hypothetical protein